MPIIEIDDDVYQHLLRRAIRIGEDGSSILRRELNLPEPPTPTVMAEQDYNAANFDFTPYIIGPLKEYLRSSRAREGNITRRYLEILSRIAEEQGEEFANVLTLRGRRRLYFALTEEELNSSGTSLYPQRIPSSKYWAMTNSDNVQKRQILTEVMKLLKYPEDVISQARGVLY